MPAVGMHGLRDCQTERPVRSTPSTAVHERVGIERRQLYLPVRRHMARMARAAETRENGRRRREVVPRFMITPLGPAL